MGHGFKLVVPEVCGTFMPISNHWRGLDAPTTHRMGYFVQLANFQGTDRSFDFVALRLKDRPEMRINRGGFVWIDIDCGPTDDEGVLTPAQAVQLLPSSEQPRRLLHHKMNMREVKLITLWQGNGSLSAGLSTTDPGAPESHPQTAFVFESQDDCRVVVRDAWESEVSAFEAGKVTEVEVESVDRDHGPPHQPPWP
jgi:hypothetical protein